MNYIIKVYRLLVFLEKFITNKYKVIILDNASFHHYVLIVKNVLMINIKNDHFIKINKMFFSCFKKNNKIINEDIILYIECSICYEYFFHYDIKILIPCGHRSICNHCLQFIKKCPICNLHIEKVIKIYDKLVIINSNN